MDDEARAGVLQQRIQSRYPGSFAGMWIEHSPLHVYVAMTSPADADLRALVASAQLTARVEFKVAQHSIAELLAAAESFAGEIRADVSINVQTNRVEAAVLAGDEPAARLRSMRIEQAATTVRVVPELARPATDIYGGIGGGPQGWYGCPSGFIVHNFYTGVDGFVTAGHCGDDLNWYGNTLPIQAQFVGTDTDVQWHTAPGYTTPPFFRYSGTNLRAVSSVGYWFQTVAGQTRCKNGPTLGYKCGTVDTPYVAPGYIPNAAQVFVRVKACTDIAYEGDSGGPTFLNYTAYGIVSGYEWDLNPGCWMKKMLLYDPQDFWEDHFPIAIKTA